MGALQAVHVADYHKLFLVSAHYPPNKFDSHVTVSARPPASARVFHPTTP